MVRVFGFGFASRQENTGKDKLPGAASHVLGHGLHAHADFVLVLVEGVNLHDGGSDWVCGEILEEKERSWSGRSRCCSAQRDVGVCHGLTPTSSSAPRLFLPRWDKEGTAKVEVQKKTPKSQNVSWAKDKLTGKGKLYVQAKQRDLFSASRFPVCNWHFAPQI